MLRVACTRFSKLFVNYRDVFMNIRPSFVIIISTLIYFWGCTAPPAEGDDVDSECRLNNECSDGEICVNGTCTIKENASTRNTDENCFEIGCACTQDAECRFGLGCDATSQLCFEVECNSDRECVLGQECDARRCVTDVNSDRDQDGVPDGTEEDLVDNCPDLENPEQEDLDADGIGDSCDPDIDNDNILNEMDNCPRVPNANQSNLDQDLYGDECDEDDDNDGIKDDMDNCPQHFNIDQSDLDFNTIGDLCEPALQVVCGECPIVRVFENGSFLCGGELYRDARAMHSWHRAML